MTPAYWSKKPSSNYTVRMVFVIVIHYSNLHYKSFETSKGSYSFKQIQTRGQFWCLWLILSRIIGNYGKPVFIHIWDGMYLLSLVGYFGGKLEVEDVGCVTQHMDRDVTCLNPSVLATSFVAFMRFKGIWEKAHLFSTTSDFFPIINKTPIQVSKPSWKQVGAKRSSQTFLWAEDLKVFKVQPVPILWRHLAIKSDFSGYHSGLGFE